MTIWLCFDYDKISYKWHGIYPENYFNKLIDFNVFGLKTIQKDHDDCMSYSTDTTPDDCDLSV